MILIIILYNYTVKQGVPIQSQEFVTVYEQVFYFAAVAHILLLDQNQSFVALEEEEDLPPVSQSSGTWLISWCQTCLYHGNESVSYIGLCLLMTQLKEKRGKERKDHLSLRINYYISAIKTLSQCIFHNCIEKVISIHDSPLQLTLLLADTATEKSKGWVYTLQEHQKSVFRKHSREYIINKKTKQSYIVRQKAC